MRRYLAVGVIAAVLSGCQAAAGSAQDVRLADFEGATVGQLASALQGFRLVGSSPYEGKRIFYFADEPAIVTTTLPAYVPAPRLYNSPQMGIAFNNLAAAVGTVPEVSRTSVMQCRVYVLATARGAGRALQDWTIIRSEHEGQC
jgi:hypothetical protein